MKNLSSEAQKGYKFDELTIGQSVDFKRIISENDVLLFSTATGDKNPIHLDEEYAKTTQFGQKIVHGMLTASLFSAIIAQELPGPGVIYISQSLDFRRAVPVGSEVEVCVTVKELNPKKCFATLTTIAKLNNKIVVAGEAVVMVPN